MLFVCEFVCVVPIIWYMCTRAVRVSVIVKKQIFQFKVALIAVNSIKTHCL
jgi:hypothetical protein